jgi:photosystem II stability/assembly factor-like uncharacterized protein
MLWGAASLCACSRPSARPPLWQVVAIPTDAIFSGICFVDSLEGWLSGGGWAVEGGIVGHSRDGGRSWRFHSGIAGHGGDFALGRLHFFDAQHGISVGRYGSVVLSEDGGESWRNARRSVYSGASLFDLQFLDRWHGWAAGPGSFVRTSDGGETWESPLYGEQLQREQDGCSVHFVDTERGWLAGMAGTLYRSADAGTTWSVVPLPFRPNERPNLRDVWFLDQERGWVVGEQGCIFHTADGGMTWTLQENGVPVVRTIPNGEPPRPREPLPELEVEPDRLALFAVQFADAQRGWTVGYYSDVAESVVLGTHDGGVSWQIEHVQSGELLRTLFVLDREHAWAAGDRARTQTQVVLRLR